MNNEFKEYKEGGWVKSENLDTPKEAFPYEFVVLPELKYSVKNEDIPMYSTTYIKIGELDLQNIEKLSKVVVQAAFWKNDSKELCQGCLVAKKYYELVA